MLRFTVHEVEAQSFILSPRCVKIQPLAGFSRKNCLFLGQQAGEAVGE